MGKLLKYWREITIVSLLLWAIVRGNNEKHCEPCYNKLKEIDTIVNTNEITEWEGFDALSFNEAFSQMYLEHGQGHVFDWRNEVYLTNLKEGE